MIMARVDPKRQARITTLSYRGAIAETAHGSKVEIIKPAIVVNLPL